MSMLDTYRNNAQRKQQDINSLQKRKAAEMEKKYRISQKIMAAKSACSRTKSSQTIKSKLSEIDRLLKEQAQCEKTITDLTSRMVTKEKEYNQEIKRADAEEARLRKKQIEEDKKRQKESEAKLMKMAQDIERQRLQQSVLMEDIDALKRVPETVTVLFFATNPHDTSPLRLDEEVRGIQEMIRKSEHRDFINFESRWAVRPMDILQAINEVNPTVLHFSGHGAANGDLVLENTDGSAKLVSKESIAQVISTVCDQVRLVIFDACYSEEQAEATVKHIDAAIGMNMSIGDETAKVFMEQFYSSIGFGHSIKKAFEQAKANMTFEHIDEVDIPVLYTKENLDPSEMFIVKAPEIS